jgi:hypothetical protein
MKTFATLIRRFVVAAMASVVGSAPALAASFVYVSNAEDGDIGVYKMLDSGELQPGARVKAAGVVMPMFVSPDRRFLYAASLERRPSTLLRTLTSLNVRTRLSLRLMWRDATARVPVARPVPALSLSKR